MVENTDQMSSSKIAFPDWTTKEQGGDDYPPP